LEERVAQGILVFTGRGKQSEKAIVDEIIWRHIGELEKELNGREKAG
jgi:hypothetical protein